MIEDIIGELHKVDSSDAYDNFLKILTNHLGFKQYWYMLSAKTSLEGIADSYFISNNYHQEFKKDYFCHKRHNSDAVMKGALAHLNKALLWDELFDRKKLPEESLKQLEWASDYDVNTGLIVPMSHSNGELCLLNFVLDKEDLKKQAKIKKLKKILPAYTDLMYYKIKSILDREIMGRQNKLTSRQTECLLWAAKGKTIWETAQILGLSEFTVREHLKTAMEKLNAKNKVEAIAKSIVYKQINAADLNSYFS